MSRSLKIMAESGALIVTPGHPSPWSLDVTYNCVASLTLTGAHRVATRGLGIVPAAGGGVGTVGGQGASGSWRSANRELRRGTAILRCTFTVASLVDATFVAMCCTKLEKTSSADSVTPKPIVRTSDTPSISRNNVDCVSDCGCVAILHCDLSLLENQVLGLLKALPDLTIVFRVRTFQEYRLQHTGIPDVGHVESGYPHGHPNVCFFEIHDVILDVSNDIVDVVVLIMLWMSL